MDLISFWKTWFAIGWLSTVTLYIITMADDEDKGYTWETEYERTWWVCLQWRIQDFPGAPTYEVCLMINYYRPRSEASEGYVFTGVCYSLCSTPEGGGLPSYQGRPTPTLSKADPPPPPRPRQTPPPAKADPPGQGRPPSPARGIRSMGGRYASYWNAYLFCKIFAENCMKKKEFKQRWGPCP